LEAFGRPWRAPAATEGVPRKRAKKRGSGELGEVLGLADAPVEVLDEGDQARPDEQGKDYRQASVTARVGRDHGGSARCLNDLENLACGRQGSEPVEGLDELMAPQGIVLEP
jgi:hypothetical protein